jgi:protein-tyrosine phosphatase
VLQDGEASVFVHCKFGISRSATVVLGYLMKRNGWTLSKAYGYLKKLRPAVQPNLGFQLVLRDWERELFGTASVFQATD